MSTKIEVRKLHSGESVKLQTEAGFYLTLKAKKSGELQIVNYRAPLFDWHGYEVDLRRRA